MTLAPGTRLGPYEVLSPLGAGGMGEVYRARDSKLKRDVAIKVLPESLAADPDALARFEREALAVAALSHPNILSIFDFGSQDGVSYAVMELLEGETLRGKLDAGPISLRQAENYALQLIRGLSAAHEQGIIHRDLKPENLFVSKDGHLKILDFGLAKRVETVSPDGVTSTLTESNHTKPGTVMGTAGYMSPEQVRGLPMDHRSDIFSFGAILYELLSGKRAFQRKTAADTMSAILNEEPPELLNSGRNVSPALDHVVKHCLEKDQTNRFQSAKDIAFALSEASGPAMASGVRRSTFVPGTAVVFVAAAVVLVAISVGGVFLVRHPRTVPGRASGPKRIAVLPFENLGAAEDGYFAAGMTDEVRSKLSKLSGLSVIASGSSGLYQATTKPPDQIARELGVRYLLLAKVRWQKSGATSRIRVSPELVEVEDGSAPITRWQEGFDADLADIFKVQVEIATKVAYSLSAVLSGREREELAAHPTSNFSAYDAYLRASEIFAKSGDERKCIAELERAVALDPGFALAWAKLSLRHSITYNQSDPSPIEAEAARRSAERAVELAPDSARTSEALAWYHRFVKKDDARAREILSAALKATPNDARLLLYAAAVEPNWESALTLRKRAADLDPRSDFVQHDLALTFIYLRRTTDARAACDKGLATSPSHMRLLAEKAVTYLQEGDLTAARTVLSTAPAEVDPSRLLSFICLNWDIDWALDDVGRDLVLRLTPSAFNDDRGRWSISLAKVASRRADTKQVRTFAEEARISFAGRLTQDPDNRSNRLDLSLALAFLGLKEEAIREGERGAALAPGIENASLQHSLVRVHILCGNHEKAIDLLERLLKTPYWLTPAWLRIDPTFDSLRGNPRFQKLVAGN